jgi:hypothetical protein
LKARVGPPGKEGPPGPPGVGPEGPQGKAGEQGDAGAPGIPGVDNDVEGPQGAPGKDGTPGEPGKDGAGAAPTAPAGPPLCRITRCKHGGQLDEASCRCDCIKGFSGEQCEDCVFDGEAGRVVVGVCKPKVHAEGVHGGEAHGIHGSDEAHGIHGAERAVARSSLSRRASKHPGRGASKGKVKVAEHLRKIIQKLTPRLRRRVSARPHAGRSS